MADAAAVGFDDVLAGNVGPQTTVSAVDLDQDGQDEYVLANNRVYACFERWGGRSCTGLHGSI
jgi:hypothetical protein